MHRIYVVWGRFPRYKNAIVRLAENGLFLNFMDKDSSGVKVVLAAVAGNGALTIGKSVAWFFTASPSMLAEAIHSFADTTNQLLLYVGIRQSEKGPSHEYPLGKSAARYMWNLISAVGVFFIGFGVTAYHGIESLIHPRPYNPDSVGWLTIGVLVAAFVIEFYVSVMAYKEVSAEQGDRSLWEYIRTGDDPTPVAILLEDSVAVLGVIFAAVGIWLSSVYQSTIPDAIASCLIALLLGIMAVILGMANGRLLIGVAASPAEQEEFREFIEQHPSVEKVALLRTEVLGPDRVSLAAEVEFHGGVLFDRDQIKRDAEKIRSGEEDPLPVLVSTAERTVRNVGIEINLLEKKLRRRFPQLVSIELEVN